MIWKARNALNAAKGALSNKSISQVPISTVKDSHKTGMTQRQPQNRRKPESAPLRVSFFAFFNSWKQIQSLSLRNITEESSADICGIR